jgi:hypothetical protein
LRLDIDWSAQRLINAGYEISLRNDLNRTEQSIIDTDPYYPDNFDYFPNEFNDHNSDSSDSSRSSSPNITNQAGSDNPNISNQAGGDNPNQNTQTPTEWVAEYESTSPMDLFPGDD